MAHVERETQNEHKNPKTIKENQKPNTKTTFQVSQRNLQLAE